MENKKGIKIFVLVVLCLVVSSSFGLAYATYTQHLTINGSAKVKNKTWKLAWSNVTENSGSIPISGLPTINANNGVASISGWSGEFSQYGEKISFNITVKNYGNYIAKLTGITNSSNQNIASNLNSVITCSNTGTSNNPNDYINVCNDIDLTIKKDGVPINSYLNNVNNLVPNTGTETYTVELSYNQSDTSDVTASKTAKDEVTVTVGTINFVYTQK